LLPYLCLLI